MQRNRQNLENSEVILETEGKYGCYSKKRNTRHDWRPEGKIYYVSLTSEIVLCCLSACMDNFAKGCDF